MNENLVLIIIAALAGLLVGTMVTSVTTAADSVQPHSPMSDSNSNDMMNSGGMMDSAGNNKMMSEHMVQCKEMMGMMH